MTKTVLIPILSICIVGCASERLQVTVTDSSGNPIPNAVVRVGFSTSHLLFGGGNSRTSKSGYEEGRTDKNVRAMGSPGYPSDFFGVWQPDNHSGATRRGGFLV